MAVKYGNENILIIDLPQNDGEYNLNEAFKSSSILKDKNEFFCDKCFVYQKYNEEISEKIKKLSEDAILEYERHMYNHDFHRITYTLDSYIREVNKYWVGNAREADKNKAIESKATELSKISNANDCQR